MAKQSILWTALPNGYSDDGLSLRVSLLISPRLEPDFNPQLEGFADFVDWPATLARSRFLLHFDGQPPVSVGGQDFVSPTRIDDRLGRPEFAGVDRPVSEADLRAWFRIPRSFETRGAVISGRRR